MFALLLIACQEQDLLVAYDAMPTDATSTFRVESPVHLRIELDDGSGDSDPIVVHAAPGDTQIRLDGFVTAYDAYSDASDLHYDWLVTESDE